MVVDDAHRAADEAADEWVARALHSQEDGVGTPRAAGTPAARLPGKHNPGPPRRAQPAGRSRLGDPGNGRLLVDPSARALWRRQGTWPSPNSPRAGNERRE